MSDQRPPHILAPVPEDAFLRGHRAVTADVDDDPSPLSLARVLGVLSGVFDRAGGLPGQIAVRLMALCAVQAHPLMAAWQSDGEAPGVLYVEEALLRTAAGFPLDERGQFDPEAFFREVLRRSDVEGES